mmetsp:Transcript_7629/g.17838  ORF Transcript_7629/g.17838 Transcript_7629/m.17838 type:complete len:224 (-) Transcript_7629:565-1236(-)
MPQALVYAAVNCGDASRFIMPRGVHDACMRASHGCSGRLLMPFDGSGSRSFARLAEGACEERAQVGIDRIGAARALTAASRLRHQSAAWHSGHRLRLRGLARAHRSWAASLHAVACARRRDLPARCGGNTLRSANVRLQRRWGGGQRGGSAADEGARRHREQLRAARVARSDLQPLVAAAPPRYRLDRRNRRRQLCDSRRGHAPPPPEQHRMHTPPLRQQHQQ